MTIHADTCARSQFPNSLHPCSCMTANKLVAELREFASTPRKIRGTLQEELMRQAADEIERLEKEVAVAQQHEDEVIVSHMNFIEYGEVLEAERDRLLEKIKEMEDDWT